jgi:hypothetical protein
VKAELRRIDTNSATVFEDFRPEHSECFGFWINASIGSDEGTGADDFQILVCNGDWLAREGVFHRGASERHLLLDGPYDPDAVIEQLKRYLETCVGHGWMDIVDRVSKIGYWEFENYEA